MNLNLTEIIEDLQTLKEDITSDINSDWSSREEQTTWMIQVLTLTGVINDLKMLGKNDNIKEEEK